MKKFFSYFFLVIALTMPSAIAAESELISIVISRDLVPYQEAVKEIETEFLRRGMKVEISYYQLEGETNRGAEIAEKMAAEGSRIAVTIGTEAFLAMKPHVGPLKVVSAMIYDPIGEGLLEGMDSSTVCGAYLKVPFSIQFSMLQQILPEVKRLSLIYFVSRKEALDEARKAERHAPIQVVPFGIRTLKEFLPALEKARSKSDAFLMTLDQELYSESIARELLLFSARNRFPVVAFSPNYVESGALISFSADYRNNGRAAAHKVLQILKGKATDPPFSPPQELVVAWNHRAANTFNISLSKEAKRKINAFF